MITILQWLQAVHEELIGIRMELAAIKALHDDMTAVRLEAMRNELHTGTEALAVSVASADAPQT